MGGTTGTALVIKEHDFQNAKNSLKQYAEQAKRAVDISKVPTEGGLFKLGSHMVKGDELNDVISKIQGHLIDINRFNQGLVNEFDQVYQAFEFLDRDYISGIVGSIQATEKVSKDEQKDRANIKALVQRLNMAVEVLEKFKGDIEKLGHLMDVDATYELIKRQEDRIQTFGDFKDKLSALQHIEDIDALWHAKESQTKALEDINQQLGRLGKMVQAQDNAILGMTELMNQADQKQQSFADATNKTLDEKQAAMDCRFDEQDKGMQTILSDLRDFVIKSQEAQDVRIEDASKVQADSLAQIANEQSEALARISNEQREWINSTNESLEKEKAALVESVSVLTQKVKTAYIVAGGATVLAALHMILSILGVL